MANDVSEEHGFVEGAEPSTGVFYRYVRSAIEQAGKPDAALEARILLEHFAGIGRVSLVMEADKRLKMAQVEPVLSALQRRLAGEPVYRIVGQREFYGLTLKLSRETLEPRPDTEALVDLALPYVQEIAARHGACKLLDMGTGTGAIALALLSQEPKAIALVTDISEDALATATANADMNGMADRFTAIRSSWFADIAGRFHVIVSNPPYIPSKDIDNLDREVRDYDPIAALDGGKDGLNPYREIAAQAKDHLEPDGLVAVEMGYDQPDAVEQIFAQEGFVLRNTASDLGGHRRALAFSTRFSE